MRNIHVFVARYSYNMNMQNFVERQPKIGRLGLNRGNRHRAMVVVSSVWRYRVVVMQIIVKAIQ